MNYTTECSDSSWFETGFVVDMGSFYAHFERLPDQRHARGKRYKLAQICVLTTLAKLSSEDRPLGIAEWAQVRHNLLGPLLGLPKRMPCHNTYRRVLGDGVTTTDLQQQVSAFLTGSYKAVLSVLIAIDGKTLREARFPKDKAKVCICWRPTCQLKGWC